MHDFRKCPRCNSDTVKSTAFNGGESEFWRNCSKCNTYINTYLPQPHQLSVHEDPHTFIGNFGGFGTGKTYTSRQEIYKHAFITPNANILVCANVAKQYEQTIKRDIENDIPKDFVKAYSVQKQHMDLINGARIMYSPLDDPDKLRSLNLSMFIIIEASETSGDSFSTLKTRARNLAATVPLLDTQGNPQYRILESGDTVPIIKTSWIKGIVESNPDSGWIRNELLLTASKITNHGHVLDHYEVPDEIKDEAISAHIVSTNANAYLPPDYIKNQTKNKPLWWVNRFIFGSFSFSEGLVYPAAAQHYVPYFDPPPEWKKIIAADYGLADDFVYLNGAIDPLHGILYIYREIRTNNRNIEELANLYFTEVSPDIPVGGLYCAPILDPKSGAKRDYNKKSLYDHFLDYGIYFIPGQISVDARVFKTNTYFESGKIKIMTNCTGLIKELDDYKFPPKKLNVVSKSQDKPMDKNNHAINPLEWMVMELPKNPADLCLGAYDGTGLSLEEKMLRKSQAHIPPQLRDDPYSSAHQERSIFEWRMF